MHDRTPISVTTILPAGINTPYFDKSLTRIGVKPRPSPPIYEPAAVAEAILYAAEHPVCEVYVEGLRNSWISCSACPPAWLTGFYTGSAQDRPSSQ